MSETLIYDNVFESLVDDVDEAADLSFRADLISALVECCRERGWSQAEIGAVLGIPQPRVGELMRGKVHLFSADRLIGFLSRLGVRLRPSFSGSQFLCVVETYPAA